MLKALVKLANRLDSLGLTKEADVLDREILKVASVNSSLPEDMHLAPDTLKKIVELDSYHRWLYMTKDRSKNTEYLQSAVDSENLTSEQKDLLDKIFELCSEDFEHESEFELRRATEDRDAPPTDEELYATIERMKDEDDGEGDTVIPDYGGRGVSVFRDPKAPFLDERGNVIREKNRRHTIKVHKKPNLSDSDITVRDLESAGIPTPVRSKDDSSIRMSPEDKARFDAQLERQLVEMSGQQNKKNPSLKTDRINTLKLRIEQLRDYIQEEQRKKSLPSDKGTARLTDEEKKNKKLKTESERENLVKKIDELDTLTRSLTDLLTGSVASSDFSEEATTNAEPKKKLSEYTIADIEPDYYYVFQLMSKGNSNKKFWIAMGEFEDEQEANEFSDLLDSESGKEDTSIVIDGFQAKELVYDGDARFRLERWSRGDERMPRFRTESIQTTQRLDPEKQEMIGASKGKLF